MWVGGGSENWGGARLEKCPNTGTPKTGTLTVEKAPLGRRFGVVVWNQGGLEVEGLRGLRAWVPRGSS